MAAAAPMSRHDFETKLVKRCWENDGFRQEFLADPTACFVKYTKLPTAQLPKIIVHEEQAGSWHIVLPTKPENTGELTDEELERIAGGTDLISTAITVFATVVSTALVGACIAGLFGSHPSSW